MMNWEFFIQILFYTSSLAGNVKGTIDLLSTPYITTGIDRIDSPVISELTHLESRIVNGKKAVNKQFPFVVSLRRAITGSHFCGGSIVSDNWILSAGHCMSQDGVSIDRKSFFAVGGDVKLRSLSFHKQKRDIFKYIRHSKYNDSTLKHDIAVIKLLTPFKLTEFVQPIPISKKLPADNTRCITAGWGYLHEDGEKVSNNLKYIDLPLLSRRVCKSLLGHLSNMGDGLICAGYPTGGTDACQGDSGGPLICDGMLTGIISGGDGCGRPQLPGFYTNVAFYKIWIGTTMESDNINILQKFRNYDGN